MFFSQICSSFLKQTFSRFIRPNSLLPTRQFLVTPTQQPLTQQCSQTFSTSQNFNNKYASPLPYKNPKPRKYGYKTKYFTGGLLPRIKDENSVKGLPPYKPRDSWSVERALFGQNDYIDILGDGNIHPKDLIRGPAWLVGYRGNEMKRLTRRLRFEGPMLRNLYPTKYHKIQKRIRWLFRFYNIRRHKTKY